MKKLILLAIPAALVATPAFAQSASGSVGVTGVVGGRCAALTPITGTFDVGEMALTNGTVDTAFSNHVTALTKNFTVVCTSPNAQVSIDADPLDNAADNSTANGYTGRVHYTASMVLQRAGLGTHTYIYTTTNTPSTLSAPLGGRLANVADNVSLSISNAHTDNTGDLLKSGTYNSTINITIAPL